MLLLFIVLFITGTAKILLLVREIRYDRNSFRNSSSDELYYMDYRHRLRYKPTDEPCSIHIDNNGDRILTNIYTQKPVINLTKYEYDKAAPEGKAKAIAEGKETFIYDSRFNRGSRSESLVGQIYEDIKTGDRYVIRKIGAHKYYINIKDFSIVRKIESEVNSLSRVDDSLEISEYYKELDLAENKLRYVNQRFF